jgi:hypothetical protein
LATIATEDSSPGMYSGIDSTIHWHTEDSSPGMYSGIDGTIHWHVSQTVL